MISRTFFPPRLLSTEYTLLWPFLHHRRRKSSFHDRFRFRQPIRQDPCHNKGNSKFRCRQIRPSSDKSVNSVIKQPLFRPAHCTCSNKRTSKGNNNWPS